MKRMAFILFLLVFFIEIVSASLGITPALHKINFIPGQSYEFSFTILSDTQDKESELYLAGDLAKYGKLSKDKVIGTDGVRVSITLPEEILSPGQHSLIVRAKELPSESEFLGTVIDIGAPIVFFLPYPGRYVELQLNIPSGNIDDKIPVELKAINRGKEELNLNEVYVDFFTNNEKVSTLSYSPVGLAVGEERYFRKFLDTTGYKAGDYFAAGYVDYGEVASANQTFRIGSFLVNITNFTERLPQKGIQKFHVGVESLWNLEMSEVFAEVNASMDSENFGFRTPPINLPAWQTRNLEGFVDTSALEGTYDLNITVYYGGQKTSADGKLQIYKYSSLTILLLVGAGGMLVIIIIGVLIWLVRRKHRKKQ